MARALRSNATALGTEIYREQYPAGALESTHDTMRGKYDAAHGASALQCREPRVEQVMSAVSLGDVKQAAAIIGANITDEDQRAVVAAQFAALFSSRFRTFDRDQFLNQVERAAANPQDYETVTEPLEPGAISG